MWKKKRPQSLWRGAQIGALLCAAFLWTSLGHTPEAHAGPWSQKSGHFYVKAAQSLMFGKESVSPDGSLGGGDFFGALTQVYGEVGIAGGLQFQFFVPYGILRFTRENGESFQVDSFMDSIMGFQWTPTFLQKAIGFPIALRFNAKVPLYNQQSLLDDEQSRARIGRFPIIGEGQVDFTLWLSIGGAIPKTPLYAFAEIGYRFRTELFVDQRIQGLGIEFLDGFVFNSQFGYNIFNRAILMLNFSGIIPFGSNLVTKGFVNIGLGAYIPIWKGLAAEVNFDQSVWWQAAPPATVVTLGISYKY